MAKGKKVTLSLELGKGLGDVTVETRRATKAGAEAVTVQVGSTTMTKSEVCESLRQIERQIQGMDWPPA